MGWSGWSDENLEKRRRHLTFVTDVWKSKVACANGGLHRYLCKWWRYDTCRLSQIWCFFELQHFPPHQATKMVYARNYHSHFWWGSCWDLKSPVATMRRPAFLKINQSRVDSSEWLEDPGNELGITREDWKAVRTQRLKLQKLPFLWGVGVLFFAWRGIPSDIENYQEVS